MGRDEMTDREPHAIVQLKIRMREETRARLESAAEEHRQSLNAEAVARLERSFADEDRFGGPDLLAIVNLMAGAFLRGGQQAAAYKGHPEWTAGEWINDPLAYETAVASVQAALAAAQPRRLRIDPAAPNPETFQDILSGMARQIADGGTFPGSGDGPRQKPERDE